MDTGNSTKGFNPFSKLLRLDISFVDHGQQVTLTSHNSSFGPLTLGVGNHIFSHKVNDNSFVRQTISPLLTTHTRKHYRR